MDAVPSASSVVATVGCVCYTGNSVSIHYDGIEIHPVLASLLGRQYVNAIDVLYQTSWLPLPTFHLCDLQPKPITSCHRA